MLWLKVGIHEGSEIYSIFISMNVNRNDHYSLIYKVSHNKYMRAINGNQHVNKLVLSHWSKGNNLVKNKTSELNLIMNQDKADVMSVVEANLGHQSNLIKSEFHEFNVELSLMSQQTQVSRNILLINKNLQYSRRYDLETIHTLTV